MKDQIFDFIGVGIGPFNLSLASLTSNINCNGIFFDQAEGFDWHPGMMLQASTLQTPFMCDLVTMADPTHPLSFLNYKKQQGHLYSFYIKEDFYLVRKEYNRYCQWATKQLANLKWQHKVESIQYSHTNDCYEVTVKDLNDQSKSSYFAKHIVLGTGTSPHYPSACKNIKEDSRITHTAEYLDKKQQLQQQKSITVVGGGQSAAEVYYDLLQDIDIYNYQLNWITRSPRFLPLELSKLTLEMTSPEYSNYFYDLPEAKRTALINQQTTLYKGINFNLINDIFDLLYLKREYLDDIGKTLDVNLICNCSLEKIDSLENNLKLSFYNQEAEKQFNVETGSLIVGTGYQYQYPAFLNSAKDRINFRQDGYYQVNRNFSINDTNDIFVQNAELHTHGFVSPDLGMVCYRNSHIIREITGIEHYPIETHIAFQAFGSLNQYVTQEAKNPLLKRAESA